MRVALITSLLLGTSLSSFAQFRFDPHLRGILSVGLRNTVSTFHNAGATQPGLGVGGHFRLNFNSRVNTEWHADYITAAINHAGKRNVYHIGWSVMYYPIYKTVQKFTAAKPYFMIGHCFDLVQVVQSSDNRVVAKRWSAAPTVGIGNHFPIKDRIDFSFALQYMLHVGKGLEARAVNGSVAIEERNGFLWDGHVLLTMSVNYKLKKLWKEKG